MRDEGLRFIKYYAVVCGRVIYDFTELVALGGWGRTRMPVDQRELILNR